MIRMIAKDLRINPLRTSLTALSMFIGIIALIAGVLVGTLGRDYLEAVNARLGGKSPTYSAIVDVPSSVNIQVVTALQERLAHFRPGIASAQYHLNDLAIWASSDDGNTEIRRVTIIITDAERTRIMPAPIIEGTCRILTNPPRWKPQSTKAPANTCTMAPWHSPGQEIRNRCRHG